jgi:hypothetical protein
MTSIVSAETRLQTLLEAMQPRLHADVFLFVALPPGAPVADGLSPILTFREAEGTTLVIEAGASANAGLQGIYRCRMITLQVHSALEAVGFLAAITSALAALGLGANAVSAFHHDHLFVAEHEAERAMETLRDLSARAAAVERAHRHDRIERSRP